MRKIELRHKGRHGLTKLAVMVPDDAESGQPIEVSERVAKRVNEAVCGIDECVCGDRIAWRERDKWYLTYWELVGNYA